MRKNLLLVILIFSFGVCLFAQNSAPLMNSNTASIYQYSGTLQGTEQLKIRAYVWGQVRSPGLYIVPDDTDLLTLLSSAGGPTENAKLSKVRIIRPNLEGEKVMIVDLEEYMRTGDNDLIPLIQPGDTVILSGSFYYAFTKATKFLSEIAIILSVYATVSSINN